MHTFNKPELKQDSKDTQELIKAILFKKLLPRPIFYIGLIITMSVISQKTIPRFPETGLMQETQQKEN